jgi:hypothetical protein
MTLEQLHERRNDLMTLKINHVNTREKKIELLCIDRRIAQLIDGIKGEA